ncbi:serine/threonine-protein kinase [Kribbella steppae]|nr:serine/threonine-protein kinase [Kribbella steppae]
MLVANRYRLGPSIGRGGMGEVFRATDEQLGRPVAVKLLLPSDHAARAAERFHREARAAARLSDPHVVSVYDFGQHGDGFFLVMELVEGRSLAEEVAQHGSLPKDRAIDLIEQAAAGLAAAHREDVVHRDVKPSNLLLTPDGTVKVADFGIAHLPGEGTTTLTVTGQIIGSTHYLSPERARGAQAGKASDVYALGCVLYHLVTGEPPFTAEHPAAILYQHVDATPESPSLLRPELAGPFEHVLLQMLAKDPADRPSAAAIAAGSLRAEQDPALTIATVPVGAPEPPDTEATESTNTVARGSADQSRNMALLAGVLALLATTGAVLAVVLLNGDAPRVPPTTDVVPQPGASSSTAEPSPSATRTSSTTGSTQPRTTNPTTSAPPSQSASQPTTLPTSPTATTSTTSAPTQSSTTPSVPTQGTTSTSTSPSSTPPSETPTTGTPATDTPSPNAQGND